MQLLTPIGLTALGLLLPLVLLYFLKLKRTPMQVSSVLLWSRAMLDSRANAPFQRLRRNLLLLLQILVLLLIALALARPALQVTARPARATVLLLDGSASMAATDVRPSRFRRAQAEAHSILSSLSPEDEAMVVWAGARPRVAASLGTNKAVLARAIDALEPADAPGDLKAAFTLALSATQGHGEREIVLLSDGAFDPPRDLALGDTPVRFVQAGANGQNLGIVAVDVRRRSAGVREGFVTVANYGGEEAAVDLEVRLNPATAGGDGRLLTVLPLNIPPGSERSEVFDVPEEGGLLQLSLSEGGALAADDRVWIPVPAPRRIKVGLVGDGSGATTLVRRALEADPRLQVRADLSPVEASTLDLAVFVGTRPPAYSSGRLLVINPVDGGGLFAVGARLPEPGPIHFEPQEPLTRWTGLSEVHLGEALSTTPPAGAHVLAEAGAVPAVWALERPRLKLVVVAFDLFQSDFPLRAGFPIFLANAADWLTAGRGDAPWVVAAGEIARGEEEDPAVQSVTITDPRGESRVVPVKEGEWVYDGTTRAGLYTVQAGPRTVAFAVNLLSRAESDIRPRGSVSIGRQQVQAEEVGKVKRRRELWRWLVLAAVGMLGGEWLFFHKRGG